MRLPWETKRDLRKAIVYLTRERDALASMLSALEESTAADRHEE
jgi:hypothetical protein